MSRRDLTMLDPRRIHVLDRYFPRDWHFDAAWHSHSRWQTFRSEQPAPGYD
ncbi:hypothetical protein RSSM_06258 [Rhodopirellula sallentina SM41]|uniref:Uncharacterized protein n=1 Tax=Rhodopirellula sallentina SM41 TaxID=1263870 RepID=M5TTC5_9BACT|nr:hypothetical protein RSSM_06258 [Rhodopirellula sallentina SM41]